MVGAFSQIWRSTGRLTVDGEDRDWKNVKNLLLARRRLSLLFRDSTYNLIISETNIFCSQCTHCTMKRIYSNPNLTTDFNTHIHARAQAKKGSFETGSILVLGTPLRKGAY